MDFFGYTEGAKEKKNYQPSRLAEVTVMADPAELRALARFMVEVAKEIEAKGSDFEHEHYSYGRDGDPDLVIFNPAVAG
jgi:hypothetical protein